MKYKKLTKEQIIISLDRLTRFKNTKDKYKIAVIIGPEGGSDKSDMDILNKADNMTEVSLGTNILRAETASLNLLSIINYEFNE